MVLADDSGGAWSPAPSTYNPQFHSHTRTYYDPVTGADMAVDYDAFGGQSQPYVKNPASGGRTGSYEDDYIRTRTRNGYTEAYDIRTGETLYILEPLGGGGSGGSGGGGGGGGGGSAGPQAESLREINGQWFWVNNYTQAIRPATGIPEAPMEEPDPLFPRTFSNDGMVVGINPLTGQVEWQYQFPQDPVDTGPEWDFRTINGQTAYFDPTDPAGGYNILRPAQGSLYGGTVGGQAAALLYGNAPSSNPYAAYGTSAPRISAGTGQGSSGGGSSRSSGGFDPTRTIMENQFALEALRAKNAENISYQSQLASLRANQPLTAYERMQMEQRQREFEAQQAINERNQRLQLANQFQSAVTATDPQAVAAFLASYGTIGSGIAQGGTALSDAALLPAAMTLSEGEGLQGFAEGTAAPRGSEGWGSYLEGQTAQQAQEAQASAAAAEAAAQPGPLSYDDWWNSLQMKGTSYNNPMTGTYEKYRVTPSGQTVGRNKENSAATYYYQNVNPQIQTPTVAFDPRAQEMYLQALQGMQQRLYGSNGQFNAAKMNRLSPQERFVYEYMQRNKFSPTGTQYIPQDAMVNYFNTLVQVERQQKKYNQRARLSGQYVPGVAADQARQLNAQNSQQMQRAIAQHYGAPEWVIGGDNSAYMQAQQQYRTDVAAEQQYNQGMYDNYEHYATPVDPRSMTRDQRIAAGDHPIFRDYRRPGFVDYMGNPFAPGGGDNLMAEYNVVRNNPTTRGVQGWRAGIPNPYAPPPAAAMPPGGGAPSPGTPPAQAGGAPGSGLQLLTAMQPTTMTGNEWLWENGQYVKAAPGKVIPPGTPYWTQGQMQGFAGGARETPTDEPFVVGEEQIPGVPNPELMVPKKDGTFDVIPFNQIPGMDQFMQRQGVPMMGMAGAGMPGFATGTKYDDWVSSLTKVGTAYKDSSGNTWNVSRPSGQTAMQDYYNTQVANQQPAATQPATQPTQTATQPTPGYTAPAPTIPGYTPPTPTTPAPTQPQQPAPTTPTTPAPQTPSTVGPGSSLAQWLAGQGYNLTGDITIPDYLQGYADQVSDIRQGVNYPDLNPMDVSYSLMDPVVRDLFERGRRSQYGIPLESQAFEQYRYALPGMSAGAFNMRY